jgi:predicted CoA-binding protein
MTETPSDDLLRRLLREVKSFACVGVSPNPVRPSHYVARYLKLKGYRVIPVNPGQAGQTLFGETVRADLSEVTGASTSSTSSAGPRRCRRSWRQALAMPKRPRVIWMQIGVTHAEAAARAEAEGLTVIQNRCPKIEYQRLFGELRMGARGLLGDARHAFAPLQFGQHIASVTSRAASMTRRW